MRRKFEDLNIREVLALAIAVEEANEERLGSLADFFCGHDEDLYSLFVKIRNDEVQHARILNNEWHRRFGDEPKPSLNENDVESVIEAVDVEHGEHAIFNDLTRDSALQLVIKSERSAKRFYKTSAKRCADPGLKALYLDLAAMEEGHIIALKEFSNKNANSKLPKR
jgi:rubrerythrin